MPKNKLIKISLIAIFAFSLLFSAFLFGRYFFFSADTNETQTNLNKTPVSNINTAKTPDKKTEKDIKLQAKSDSLLYLFDKMPSVPVYLVDEPIVRGGSNVEHGVAYTACENKNQPTIFVKKAFYEKRNEKQLVNILKHELVHAYFCRQGIQAEHDERFRKKFKEVGGFGN